MLRERFIKILTLVVMMVLCLAQGVAQPRGGFSMIATGKIVDSKTGEPLINAAIKATSSDGGTGTFAITDTEGNFKLEVGRPGNYTLELTYVSYKPLTKDVRLFPGRGLKLGTFKMDEDPKYLAEIETIGHSERMRQVGDTIMYNADAYKVADGASAAELVGKMPGIEVSSSGIKAQGETIEKILVDGKEFFGNDPALALNSLPAEVVQSVNVFDKKSDQAEFTGLDDGNTVKAMSVQTKSYRRNGTFGKVTAAGGMEMPDGGGSKSALWNGNLNLNTFSGDRRISILAMSNNVNQQNFSFDDLMASGGMGGGMGGRMFSRQWGSSGVSRTNALGINFSNTMLDDKLEIQGSYFFNNQRTVKADSSFSDYINFPEGDMGRASVSESGSLSHNNRHNVNMRVSYKPNKQNEFLFRPSFSYQGSDSEGESMSQTWKLPLDTLMLWRANPLADIEKYSQSYSSTISNTENSSWNAGGSLLWRHKFQKAGRTLSMNIDGQLSGSKSDGDYLKNINFTTDEFQRQNNDTKNRRFGGNVQWTEGLGKYNQLSFKYDVNYQRSSRDNNVDYYKDEAFNSIAYRDTANTSSYIQRTLNQTGELGWMLHAGQWNANVNLRYQNSHMEGDQDFYLFDQSKSNRVNPSYSTSKNYNSFLPNIRLEWRSKGAQGGGRGGHGPMGGFGGPMGGGPGFFGDSNDANRPKVTHQLELRYRVNANNPSITNLQQTVNTTNALYYSTGNPDLNQSKSHNISLRYIRSNTQAATNLMLFGNWSYTSDYTATQYLTNNTDKDVLLSKAGADLGYNSDMYKGLTLVKGARISRPVQLSGHQSAFMMLVYGFPFDLIWSNVNLSANGNYSTTPAQQFYYEEHDGKGQLVEFNSKVQQWSFTPSVNITSNISQDLDFSVRYSPTMQWVKDTQNESNNYNYLTHNLDMNLKWTFWRGFTMTHQVNYNYYGGSSMSENISQWIWNVSLGKKFLKQNRAEIQLQAFDVLGTRKGYSLNVNDTYIQKSYANFMPRYVMLSFTYKLQNYKSSSAMKERRGR